MAITPLKENPAFVIDDSRGAPIVKPASMVLNVWEHPFNRPFGENFNPTKHRVEHFTGIGTVVNKDPETGVVLWPQYASGWDEMFMRALAGGYVGNVNMTPVVDSYLAAVVSKMQNMVRTWVARVRGKVSPVKRTLDLMSRADDSQFGSADFVGNLMGALFVDNRGAIGAQVPFAYIPFDKWGEFGMEAEPIEEMRRDGDRRPPEFYVLRMTQEAFRENKGLWTVDGLYTYPTGNPEYPYWFRAYSSELKKAVWVLIHRDFGWQILAQIGPRNSLYPGFGQSGAWRFSPYESKGMAIDQMDWEHLIAQPMRGIVWAMGLDTPTQLRDQLRTFQQDKEEGQLFFYPGVFFGGTTNENSDIKVIPWSEPPAGYTPDKWQREKIDALAASFHISSTQLQVRLGEGAMTQSDVSAAMEAETAVAFWRHAVEMLWNYVAPPRITVTVIWPSDRNKRTMVETFREMSLGIQRLQPRKEGDLPTFSPEQIMELTREFVGIPVPDIEEDDISAEDRKAPEDVRESAAEYMRGATRALSAVSRKLGFSTIDYLGVADSLPSLYTLRRKRPEANFSGKIVVTKDHGELAMVTKVPEGSEWVWVITEGGCEMLLRDSRLAAMEDDGHAGNGSGQGSNDNPPKWKIAGGELTNFGKFPQGDRGPRPFETEHKWAAGQRATHIHSGTVYEIVELADRLTARVRTVESGRGAYVLLEHLRPFAFEPEGEPLEYPEEIQIDWDEAVIAANDIYIKTDPGFIAGDWEWDEERKLWVDEEGDEMTAEEMIEVRDAIADGTDEIYTMWPPPEDEEEPTEDDGRDNFLWLLFLGLIGLGVWEARMRQAIQDTAIAQWMLAMGGPEQMTDIDRERLEANILEQWQFLNNFSNTISLAILSEAMIAWEAGLYFSDTVRQFEEGRAAAFDYNLVLPAHPGDCTSECCANDRCWWRIDEFPETIEAKWIRTVAESCPTCVERAVCPPVIFDRVTGEHENRECYL